MCLIGGEIRGWKKKKNVERGVKLEEGGGGNFGVAQDFSHLQSSQMGEKIVQNFLDKNAHSSLLCVYVPAFLSYFF